MLHLAEAVEPTTSPGKWKPVICVRPSSMVTWVFNVPKRIA
jgi:hypothetical protein